MIFTGGKKVLYIGFDVLAISPGIFLHVYSNLQIITVSYILERIENTMLEF